MGWAMAQGPPDPNEKIELDRARARAVVAGINQLSDHAPTKEACLVVIYGHDLGRKHSLEWPSVTLGRSNKCDIQVDQESVSRAHSKIISSGRSIRIRDLGSTNGTYVNDESVEERTLADGDFVKIGRTIFKFLSGGNIERAYHEEIYRRSTVDALTQTLNKRCFLERLKHEPSRSTLDSRAPSLVAVKLTLLGKYDDEEADTALRALVRDVTSLVRREDFVGRYSDNVLLVFLERDCAEARSLCELLGDCQAQSKDVVLARSNLSIGLVASSGTTDAAMLVKDALRRAEAAGRLGANRVVDYDVPLQMEPAIICRAPSSATAGPIMPSPRSSMRPSSFAEYKPFSSKRTPPHRATSCMM
jgi:diguanylate cyclase (GGDEF)-like protein